MVATRRPAPSFRPNLKLSHFVYQGPEERHYDPHGKVEKQATGQADGGDAKDRDGHGEHRRAKQ
jgi:hypothetical protein